MVACTLPDCITRTRHTLCPGVWQKRCSGSALGGKRKQEGKESLQECFRPREVRLLFQFASCGSSSPHPGSFLAVWSLFGQSFWVHFPSPANINIQNIHFFLIKNTISLKNLCTFVVSGSIRFFIYLYWCHNLRGNLLQDEKQRLQKKRRKNKPLIFLQNNSELAAEFAKIWATFEDAPAIHWPNH